MNDNRIFLTCATLGVAACLCLSVIGIGWAGMLLWQDGSRAAAPADVSSGPSGENAPRTPQATTAEEFIQAAAEIETQVQELRGLEMPAGIRREVLSANALRRRVVEDFLGEYTAQEARDDALTLSAFGLLTPDFDLRAFYEDLYSEQVAGFYDDKVKAMYIVQDGSFGGPERMTYAHEFTHALQDQTYGLRDNLGITDENCRRQSEYCAAMQALVEGDASLTSETWLYTYASEQDFSDIFAFYDNFQSPVYDSAPEYMKQDFLFPYQQGKDFAQYLYDQNGWAGVDAAYTARPQSTEQILHPERYPDDAPIPVELPDLSAALPSGWREVDRDTLGEWYTYLMLSQGWQGAARQAEEEAAAAAEGWGGDAYAVYVSPDESQFILVLDMRWDNANDASEFRRALLRYASRRFNTATRNLGSGLWEWQAEGVYSTLHQDDTRTVWIIAPQQAAAEALWQILAAAP